MRKRLISSGILLWPLFLFAQVEFPTGQWTTHGRFHTIEKVRFLNQKVIAISPEGVIIYDQSVEQLSTLAKENGLGAIEATALETSAENQLIIVGYASGHIDIINQNEIINIKTLSSLNQFEQKRINAFEVTEDKVYAATDLGIFVINLKNSTPSDLFREIGQNGNPVAVMDVCIVGDTIFALTNEGIIAGSLRQNLLDFAQWRVIPYPEDYVPSHLNIYSFGSLYFASDKSLYQRNSSLGLWVEVVEVSEPILDFNLYLNTHYILSQNFLWNYEEGKLDSVFLGQALSPQNFTIGQGGQIWLGDSLVGLVKWNQQEFENFLPNSPPPGHYFSLNSFENKTYVLTDQKGCYFFENGRWQNISALDSVEIGALAVKERELFIAPKSGGLLTYQANEELFIEDFSDQIVLNSLASLGKFIVGISHNETSSFFTLDPVENLTEALDGWNPQKILDISYGQSVWLQISSREGGRAVSFNLLDQKVKRLTGGGELSSNQWKAVAHSRDDEAWVATTNGIGIYTSGTEPEDPPFLPTLGGVTIFENSQVNDLIFDGGNRCWVATSSGLWLLDDQFTSIIEIYNIENSPLPSSEILELSLTYQGLLFVLTDVGLVTFQTASSRANTQHNKVNIFPQPASVLFDDSITISGIVDSGIVKITTLAGSLVRELRAVGSTVLWDMSTNGGQKITPGIYLLFSSDNSGQETFLSKLIVRP